MTKPRKTYAARDIYEVIRQQVEKVEGLQVDDDLFTDLPTASQRVIRTALAEARAELQHMMNQRYCLQPGEEPDHQPFEGSDTE